MARTAGANLTEAVEGAAILNKADIFTSFDVNAFEVPGGRDEAWRFTPLRRLRGLHDGSAPASGAAGVEVTGAGDGVSVEAAQRSDPRLGEVGVPADRVAAQAFSSFEQATVVSIAREAEVAEPVTVTVSGPGHDVTAYGHLQVRAGELSRATVIIDIRGGGTYADNVEILVGDAAQLAVVWLVDGDDDLVYVSMHHCLLGKDAVLRHNVVQLGGELVRFTGRVRYDGSGGDAEMLGLYFADDGQHLESRLFIDHGAPNCKSNVVYKGALQGELNSSKPDAHTVWVGDVLIRAGGVGTDTFEINRNLVLADGARADSVPNLEIETGEIAGAGHASATGRFDDAQLFYLQSRGIPENQARRLIVRGFFGELIGQIGVPALQDRLTDAIERELAVTEDIEDAAVAAQN